jgi:hypothetical protein
MFLAIVSPPKSKVDEKLISVSCGANSALSNWVCPYIRLSNLLIDSEWFVYAPCFSCVLHTSR